MEVIVREIRFNFMSGLKSTSTQLGLVLIKFFASYLNTKIEQYINAKNCILFG